MKVIEIISLSTNLQTVLIHHVSKGSVSLTIKEELQSHDCTVILPREPNKESLAVFNEAMVIIKGRRRNSYFLKTVEEVENYNIPVNSTCLKCSDFNEALILLIQDKKS